MPIVDRMEFPRRYKIKDLFVFLAVIAALFGIWLNDHNQKRIATDIIISEVRIADYGTNFINLDYTVENRGKALREVRILAKVYDTQGAELASAMFLIEVPPRTKQARNKVFDELSRSLKEGEVPGKAEAKLYLRKVI